MACPQHRRRQGALHLGDPARIIAVDFVHLRLDESLGVARLDADRRKAGLGQALGQPLG